MQTFFRIATLSLAVVVITASAVALAVGLAWWLSPEESLPGIDRTTEQPAAKENTATALPETAQPAAETMMDNELQQVEAEYQKAKQELVIAIDAEEHSEGSELLHDDLGIIETAITDIVLALSINPDSKSLKRALITTYQKEVELLRKSLHLSDEE